MFPSRHNLTPFSSRRYNQQYRLSYNRLVFISSAIIPGTPTCNLRAPIPGLSFLEPLFPLQQLQPSPYGYTSPLHIQQPPSVVFQPANPAHLPQQPVVPTLLYQHSAMPSSLDQYQHPVTPSSLDQLSSVDTESEDAFTLHAEGSLKPRKDGRRAVSLSDSPNLSKGTRLYGQPSWWGEEREGEERGGEEEGHLRSGEVRGRHSRIPEPGVERVRTTSSLEGHRTCGSGTGSAPWEQRESRRDKERPTSWVIDLPVTSSTPGSKLRPARLDRFRDRRPRSADSSPTRVKRTISPARRFASPVVTTSARHTPVPAGQAKGRKRNNVGTGATSTKKVPAKKPPSGVRSDSSRGETVATPTSKMQRRTAAAVNLTGVPMEPTQREETRETPQGLGGESIPTSTNHRNLTYTIPHPLDESLSQCEASPTVDLHVEHPHSVESIHTPARASDFSLLKSASDIQVRSEPRPQRDTAYSAGETDPERPGSARKQWNNSQSQASQG